MLKIPARLLFLKYRRRALVEFSGVLTKVSNSQLKGRMIHGFRWFNASWKKVVKYLNSHDGKPGSKVI